MSQNFFQIIRPVHVHLKTDKVDLKKRPPWKKIFLHFFSIDSWSRHEKYCQMLQRLFWLFLCSKNPLCPCVKRKYRYTCSIFVFSFIQGEVFAKGTISYEKRRLIHNGLCTHIYPDWIVVPESTEDVAAIVKITNRLETIQYLNFRIGT